MPKTAERIFSDMRITILEVLTQDWSRYLETVTSCYDTAYSKVKTTLGEVQAAIIEREKAQQAVMAAVLTVVTGGVVGVFADKLAKQIPTAISTLETTTIETESAIIEVTKAAEKDSVLFEILRDTTKDAIKKGGDKLTELGLDRFKGEGPSDGFQPNGWSVARYRKLLNDGITDRARVLTRIAKFLENAADAFTPELAEAMSDGMLKNDFFDDANRIHIKDEDLLERKAELALWCAWALVRDEDYWQKQKSLAGYGPNMSEVFDFRPVLERVIELGVPKEAVTIDLNPYKIGSKKATGLDVIGFMDWAKSPDMVHTLYEGISIAGGDPHHFGISRMRDVVTLSNTAA